MRRRTFMIAAGSATTALLAGCTGESEGDETSGSNDSNENNDNDSDNESGSGDDGNDESNDDGNGGDGGLTIEEHEIVEDDYSVAIEGVVLNETGGELDYVEVEGTIYNADGQQIESPFTNTQGLGDGQEWAFELMLTSDADEIAEYELEVTDSAA